MATALAGVDRETVEKMVAQLAIVKENLRRAALAATQNLRPPNDDVLWSKMFAPGQETSIVLADNSLVTIQGITGVEAPLDDYSGGAYADRMIDSIPDRSMHRIRQKQRPCVGGRETRQYSEH